MTYKQFVNTKIINCDAEACGAEIQEGEYAYYDEDAPGQESVICGECFNTKVLPNEEGEESYFNHLNGK